MLSIGARVWSASVCRCPCQCDDARCVALCAVRSCLERFCTSCVEKVQSLAEQGSFSLVCLERMWFSHAWRVEKSAWHRSASVASLPSSSSDDEDLCCARSTWSGKMQRKRRLMLAGSTAQCGLCGMT